VRLQLELAKSREIAVWFSPTVAAIDLVDRCVHPSSEAVSNVVTITALTI
jgi:hypothetical protein